MTSRGNVEDISECGAEGGAASHTILTIISDCGVALYPTSYWCNNPLKSIRGKQIKWSQLLEEARESNYPYRQLLSRIHSELSNRDSNDLSRRIELFRDLAREQHSDVYKWFRAGHTRMSYLGLVPADIRGIINHYLRCRVELEDGTITGVMGTLQSFNDEPSWIERNGYLHAIRWHNAGIKHRGNPQSSAWSQPAEVYVYRDHLECSWYQNGQLGHPKRGYTGLHIHADRCQSVYQAEDGVMLITQRDPAIIAEAAALWREFMAGKPPLAY